MIISKEKTSDMKLRSSLLEFTETALEQYQKTKNPIYQQIAQLTGSWSADLKKDIDTLDYTQRDARRARVDKALDWQIHGGKFCLHCRH